MQEAQTETVLGIEGFAFFSTAGVEEAAVGENTVDIKEQKADIFGLGKGQTTFRMIFPTGLFSGEGAVTFHYLTIGRIIRTW